MRLHSLPFACSILLVLAPVGGRLQTSAVVAGPGAGFHPVLVVEAVYPGADALTVAESVAAPIEQQVNGVEHLSRMISRCTDDGRYTLLLSFDTTVDIDLTQVLVQNRVSLATPALPEAVREAGSTIRKGLPGASLILVLTSPDASRDILYLSQYASVQIKDELARVPGVGHISLGGASEIVSRIHIDRDKLAARSLTVDDVLKALREAKVGEKVRPADQPAPRSAEVIELRLESIGRIADAERLSELVLKEGRGGTVIQLKDVARVELGRSRSRDDASFDGRPAVALAISLTSTAKPRDVGAAVRDRMASLKKSFPPGLDCVVALDVASQGRTGAAAPPWCLLAEPVLAPATTPQQSVECRNRYADILRKVEGVQHVLSLPKNPFALFPGGPCVAAVFDAEMKEADWVPTRQGVRAKLARDVQSAEPRLRELRGPTGVRPVGYPIDLALSGPDGRAVREFGEALVARLRQTGKLTDVIGGPKRVRRSEVEIDRKKAAALGVSVTDITQTLEIVGVSPDALNLQVRNNEGRIVPLRTVVAVRQVEAPANIDRVDMRPATTVSGNPATGVSLAEARWLCETVADQVRKEMRLRDEYKLVWLQDVPAPEPMSVEPIPTPEPVPEVKFKHPVSRDVTDYEEFTGRLDASQNVELRARVSGYLVKAPADEGHPVKKGDLLYEIDSRPYRAQLEKAEAEVRLGKARVKLAEATSQRLRVANAGQRELEEARAALEESKARLATSEAALAVHKLDIDFCRVTAPIDGVIGRNYCTPGNLVVQDQTVLTTVVNSDPMYLYFDVDERTVLRLHHATQDGKTEAKRPAALTVGAGLATDNGFPYQGRLSFVDNRVNPETGTLTMRAVVPNTRNLLRPGMFARVRLAVGAPHKALLVPDEAVSTDQGVKFVYLVAEGDKVAYRTVTLGAKHDGLRVVTKGLSSDDRVIVEGMARVRPGQFVKPIAGQP